MDKEEQVLHIQLERIADALDRLAPPPAYSDDLTSFDGYIWHSETQSLKGIPEIQRLPLDTLIGIDQQKKLLLDNTRAFAQGLRANNALLWGARGTGKSSLVKAVHGQLLGEGLSPALIEIQREDLSDLPELMDRLSQHSRRSVVYCDDLAFEQDDVSYKSLKAVLEGGLSGRPENIVFYATSNRRHLMPRQMIENERGSAINPSEAAEEKISLSDRFGLWVGFHSVDQDHYLAMVDGYVRYYDIPANAEYVRSEALKWAMARGNRSGRTAHQFIVNLAMEFKVNI